MNLIQIRASEFSGALKEYLDFHNNMWYVIVLER